MLIDDNLSECAKEGVSRGVLGQSRKNHS